MKMFSKNGDADAMPAGAKRDVSIAHKTTKRPDHLVAETAECTWKIPLTLDEQFDLGRVYQELADGDEAQMLSAFTESLYQGGEGDAVKLTVEVTGRSEGAIGQAGAHNGVGSAWRHPTYAHLWWPDGDRIIAGRRIVRRAERYGRSGGKGEHGQRRAAFAYASRCLEHDVCRTCPPRLEEHGRAFGRDRHLSAARHESTVPIRKHIADTG